MRASTGTVTRLRSNFEVGGGRGRGESNLPDIAARCPGPFTHPRVQRDSPRVGVRLPQRSCTEKRRRQRKRWRLQRCMRKGGVEPPRHRCAMPGALHASIEVADMRASTGTVTRLRSNFEVGGGRGRGESNLPDIAARCPGPFTHPRVQRDSPRVGVRLPQGWGLISEAVGLGPTAS